MAIVNGRQTNFEKKKTVIFMIFFTPYWVSVTEGYTANTLFEAANQDRVIYKLSYLRLV